MVPIQLNSFTAQYFLPSVFNAPSRGSLFRIGPISIIQTCVITWKFSWTFFKFFWRIQLLWFALGWGAVILGLFSVINAGNAVQKPLTKWYFHHEGLNCGPCACEAHVITTTPWWSSWILVISVHLVDSATCMWLMSTLSVQRFARNNAGPCYLHEPWLPGRFCERFTFYCVDASALLFFGSFLLSFDFSYRCWSSPAKTKWKFGKLWQCRCKMENKCLYARHNQYAFTRLIYQWYTFSWIRLKRNFFCSLFSTLLLEGASSE